MFGLGQLVWYMAGDWQNPDWEIVRISGVKKYGKFLIDFLDVDAVIEPAEVDISRLREIEKPAS